MNAKHIAIFSMIMVAPFLIPLSNNAYGSESLCNLAGSDSVAVKKCVDNYINYQKMNRSTDSQMQQVLDSSRDTIRHDQKLQDPTQTKAWVESKEKLAIQIQVNEIQKRDWYYQYMSQNLHDMKAQMDWWKSYDHNKVPVPTTCPKWHNCFVPASPVNYTKVELKPEFTNNTSGFVNNASAIKNWYDLEKWFESKNQTKN